MLLATTASFVSCENRDVRGASLPLDASKPEDIAIAYLEERGHSVTAQETGGFYVSLNPDHGSDDITIDDALALNSISRLVGLRTLPSIEPDVMQRLRVFPELKEVAVHYGLPDESIKYLNRFPNVEKMTFWGDNYGTFESFPTLRYLRILHLEARYGEFTNETAKRIASCRNLEEIKIQRPIPPEGIEFLKALPHVHYLEVANNVIIDKGEQ